LSYDVVALEAFSEGIPPSENGKTIPHVYPCSGAQSATG